MTVSMEYIGWPIDEPDKLLPEAVITMILYGASNTMS